MLPPVNTSYRHSLAPGYSLQIEDHEAGWSNYLLVAWTVLSILLLGYGAYHRSCSSVGRWDFESVTAVALGLVGLGVTGAVIIYQSYKIRPPLYKIKTREDLTQERGGS